MLKKIIQSFKAGMTMYANSLYGDINCLDKTENLKGSNSIGRKKRRRKTIQSRGHLKVIK
ncbi:hypothetical protein [Bacillus dakarensis]|uniref:hypothetical protein n=1 Tax=Robertmurraya dakarensis TaxID=1926278 RepID=UPI000981B3DB|nr:hypothetical protein [Bacillus dakarensis]